MAGKLTSAQGSGILLVTANVGSLFEDVSCAPLITVCHVLSYTLVFNPPNHTFTSVFTFMLMNV